MEVGQDTSCQSWCPWRQPPSNNFLRHVEKVRCKYSELADSFHPQWRLLIVLNSCLLLVRLFSPCYTSRCHGLQFLEDVHRSALMGSHSISSLELPFSILIPRRTLPFAIEAIVHFRIVQIFEKSSAGTWLVPGLFTHWIGTVHVPEVAGVFAYTNRW